MIKSILLVCLFVWSEFLYAQISHGGSPMMADRRVQAVQLELNMQPETMLARQQILEEGGKVPLQFAEPIFTDFTPANSGVWNTAADGTNVWQLAISSPGARSLNLIFDRFKLRKGDQLFVYNKDRSHVLGAFTEANNKESGLFAIAPVRGDEIIVELQTWGSVDGDHQLLISAVNHDFLGVFDEISQTESQLKSAASCNVDVACSDIDSKLVDRAVCKITVGGKLLCSGTLINNTSEDGIPYFLTAAHCIENPGNTDQNVVFFFNYESPICDFKVTGTTVQTLSGAQLKSYVGNMDYALLELSEVPPASYRPYWAGWSRQTEITDSVYTVHHPQGDIKKLAYSKVPAVAADFDNPKPGGITFMDNIHWRVAEWDAGTTEKGSSGCGLFTHDDYLIGILSGGKAYCGNPIDDSFVRFNQAWDVTEVSEDKIATWLNPQGTAPMKLAGFDLYKDKVKRISQLNSTGKPVLNYSNSFKGSWSGHNAEGYEAYATSFYDYSKAILHGIYLVPQRVQYSNQTINVKVWDGSTGVPGSVLWSKNNIALKNLSKNREELFSISGLQINNPFFVGVEINYGSPVDTFSVYQVEYTMLQPISKNRAFIRKDGSWEEYTNLNTAGSNSAYWFDILASDIELETDTGDVEPSKKSVIIAGNPVRNGQLVFQNTLGSLSHVDFYSLSGKLVKKVHASSIFNSQINVSDLPSGLYLVRFNTGNQVVVRKALISQTVNK